MTRVEPIKSEAYAADVEANANAYETGICPSCEQAIPPDRLEIHLVGLDGARPECPRQDLVEIVERARAADGVQASWSAERAASWERYGIGGQQRRGSQW
jgi:hypothetical protein